MLSCITHVQLRQLALQWAVSSAADGEGAESILARAQTYLDFLLYPARPDVAAAMQERAGATTQ